MHSRREDRVLSRQQNDFARDMKYNHASAGLYCACDHRARAISRALRSVAITGRWFFFCLRARKREVSPQSRLTRELIAGTKQPTDFRDQKRVVPSVGIPSTRKDTSARPDIYCEGGEHDRPRDRQQTRRSRILAQCRK